LVNKSGDKVVGRLLPLGFGRIFQIISTVVSLEDDATFNGEYGLILRGLQCLAVFEIMRK
jgi:hypothetical protein